MQYQQGKTLKMLLNVTLVYILCIYDHGKTLLLVCLRHDCVHAWVYFLVTACTRTCLCLCVGYVHACAHYLCWSKPPPVDSCRALCSSCWVGYSLPGTGRHLRTSLRHTRTSHSHSSRGLRGNAHKHTTCCLFPLKSIPLASASNGLINPRNTRTYLSVVLNNYNGTARIGDYRNESYRIHWPLDSKLL